MWVFSLSCPAIGFQFPMFHGFANDFLQIWLIKNGSMPVNVSVVLARDDEGELPRVLFSDKIWGLQPALRVASWRNVLLVGVMRLKQLSHSWQTHFSC